MSRLTRIKEALLGLPDPERIRKVKLQEAQLELLKAIEDAEEAECNAAYHRAHAQTLVERIARLQRGSV